MLGYSLLRGINLASPSFGRSYIHSLFHKFETRSYFVVDKNQSSEKPSNVIALFLDKWFFIYKISDCVIGGKLGHYA
jgi:hypothetical protein